ncbi:MAG: monovalent cation/H(+) antiporter subunit G [Myxococcales bacterium]|nr:monovalent cation/H(+) antiporter subunit G [Myxococcales bacterium]
MTYVAYGVTGLGVLLLLVSALGLFRLPDALARQHAATKSATLALGLILIGVALHVGEASWWIRVGLIVGFLIATLPVASHMLARAAAREAYPPATLRDARPTRGERPSALPPAD